MRGTAGGRTAASHLHHGTSRPGHGPGDNVILQAVKCYLLSQFRVRPLHDVHLSLAITEDTLGRRGESCINLKPVSPAYIGRESLVPGRHAGLVMVTLQQCHYDGSGLTMT